MKVLVVGSGGREHALVWKIAQSEKTDKIYAAPGNAGICDIAECKDIKANDIEGLISLIEKEKIDITVVGPEVPLVNGIVNEFESEGLRIFGPTKEAARIEGSKVFAKNIMKKYGIPTADAVVFDNPDKAIEYIEKKDEGLVVKADGLAAGKGVIVCDNKEDACNAVKNIMIERKFGDAGERIIIEECLRGEEVSILAFSDGTNVVPLVASQDHKRALDRDRGLNTGGMGAYSPVPGIEKDFIDKVNRDILMPVVKGMGEEGIIYKGILYAGLMITEAGPKVLEFNVRFGDPETQAIIPRMKSDIMDPIVDSIKGDISGTKIEWHEKSCVCVVMASGGYPESYKKGYEIEGIDKAEKEYGVKVFQAGTRKSDSNYITNGGRVLGVSALEDDLILSKDKAYKAVSIIRFKDRHFRKDIAQKAVSKIH